MIIYQSTKEGFIDDVNLNRIADCIHTAYYEHLGRHACDSEVNSWKNSMMYMKNVVEDSQIPQDSGISIEYQVPLTSKRVDFIISGYSDLNKSKEAVVVELKQWTTLEKTSKEALVSTYVGKAIREVTHPSYQAWSYCALLANFNSNVQDNSIKLHPCAYLHNCSDRSVLYDDYYSDYTSKAPAFIKEDVLQLRSFIKRHIKYGDNRDVLYAIEKGRIRPSEHLADKLNGLLHGNQEFILIDNQKVAYENAYKFAMQASINKKRVLIIEGGPGTGKSVIAMNLLAALTSKKQNVRYISKNAAPRDVYARKLNGCYKKTEINNFFAGSGTLINEEANLFDTLIVDEAHRLNLKSGLYGNLGENQVQEIINASKVSIFFIDDKQRIHIKDIGSVKAIENIAKSCNAKIHKLKLDSQFRCNGSDGYLAWLDNVLQIRETANINLPQESFDIQIFDNPNEMFHAVESKNSNNKARVVAGYCWDWKSKKNKEDFDISIPEFNFNKKWNLQKDGSTWIIEKESINEIGCIHTCQGLELDYVGVIIGDDLSYKDGKIVTDVYKRSAKDNSIIGFKKRIKEDKISALRDADEIIKNTYRTLMTRGMKGCYVYCTDKALANYLRSRISIPEKKTITDISLDNKDDSLELRVEPVVNHEDKYVEFLPFYSIKAACGYFGNGEDVEEVGWVHANGVGRINRNMFVVQAKGHSMEPKINDGDFCVFSRMGAGSREGKIVLVEHTDVYDSEYFGSYSIKTYHSEKRIDEFSGTWKHDAIVLKPSNSDYNPIELKLEDSYDESFRVIGEFVGVLK